MAQERYIDAGDVKPGETFRDLDGREYDDEHVQDLVEEVRRDRERRGRPSLTGAGVSPQVQVRVSPELKSAIDAAAAADHTSRAEWMRRVLRRAAARRLARPESPALAGMNGISADSEGSSGGQSPGS